MLCTTDTSTKYLPPFKNFSYFPFRSYQITFLITSTCYFSPRAWTQLVKHLLEEKQSVAGVIWIAEEMLLRVWPKGKLSGLPAILQAWVWIPLLSPSASSDSGIFWFSPKLSDHQNPHYIHFLSQKNSNKNLSSAAFTWAWDLPLEIKGLLFQFLLHYLCKEIVLAEATQMLSLLQAVKIHRNWRSFLPWLLHCFTQGRMTGGQKQCRNRSLWPTLCVED